MAKPLKVTDPSRRVTDAHVLKYLTRRGMNADYVEFTEDYCPEHPSTKFYKDRVTGKSIAVVRTEPRVLPDGTRIDLSWHRDGKAWKPGANWYSVRVEGTKTTVTIPNKGQTSWNPTITVSGIEVKCSTATVPEDGVLEWDYGVCRRRMVNTRTGLQEFYVFDRDPQGEVIIDPRSEGDLHPDEYYCIDANREPVDGFHVTEGGVKTVLFPAGTAYPCIVDDSFSVAVSFLNGLESGYSASWSTIRGQSTADKVIGSAWAMCRAFSAAMSPPSGSYGIFRLPMVFDTSDLPDGITVTEAEIVCERGNAREYWKDYTSIHLYSGMPTYPHNPVVVGDYGLSNYSDGHGQLDITDMTWNSLTGLYEQSIHTIEDEDWVFTLTEAGRNSIITDGDTKWLAVSEHDNANLAPSLPPSGYRDFGITSLDDVSLVVEYDTGQPPEVTTLPETDAYVDQARIHGTVDEGTPILERGFDRWDDDTSAAVELWTEEGEFGLEDFDYLWEGLAPHTTVSYRAKARNAFGWGYGAWRDINIYIEVPMVETHAADEIEQYQADLHGEITFLGFVEYCTAYGFQWRKQENAPNWTHDWQAMGQFGLITFSHTPTLEPGTIYEFRAMAQNAEGWGYGDVLEFETLPFPPHIPTVETYPATDIHTNTATGNGAILDTGGDEVLCDVRGFQWGLSHDSLTNTVQQGGAFDVGAFSQQLTGLPDNTTIYYRAFATNEGGTGYGNVMSFRTLTRKDVTEEWLVLWVNVSTQQVGVVHKLVERHGVCRW